MDRLYDLVDLRELLTQAVSYIPELFAAVLIIIVFWGTFRMTRHVLTSSLERAGLDHTLVHLVVENIYRYTLLILGLIMAADQLGFNVGTALAGIGVAGIAVGFAAQDTLANFLAGFIIFMDKPFVVGDWIRVAEHYGQINDITMRSTRIRTRRNTYVVIPNKTVIDTVLVNHSKQGATRVDVPISIAYKEKIPQARAVLLQAIGGMAEILHDPAPSVAVVKLDDSSVNLEIYAWIPDASNELPTFSRMMEVSKLALDEAGIEIPYHHLQLFVENVEDRVWQKAAKFMRAPLLDGGNSTTKAS
jgi:small conductance mechanosensitive channel